MKKLMVIITIAAAVCGCVANKPTPKGVDSLTTEDINIMVGCSIEKINRGVNRGMIPRKSPNVRIVAKIQPFEVLNLPTDARVKEIVSELEMRLCKELTDGGRFLFPDAPCGAALGVTLQPDCILKGKLSCVINENGGFSTSEFRLKLTIVDVRTGNVAWDGNVVLGKTNE